MRGQSRPPSPEPFGVYIHFPFCRSKCGYCDFASVALGVIPDEAYTAGVLRELEARASSYIGRELRSIYFGGGTPSLWRHASLERVLRRVSGLLSAPWSAEVTLELNPGPPNAPLAEVVYERLLEAGVNRLSVGIQSLDDRMLELLGRVHDAGSARAVVRRARTAGFPRISCDLIFGLPGQTLAHHLEQLRALVDLEPDHISAYCLTLSPFAPMKRAGMLPAQDDHAAEMMAEGAGLLLRAGYEQYEVSSFARLAGPRHVATRSVHNALVWAGWPYLGLGAHAHSMLPDGFGTLRVANPGLEHYLGRMAFVEAPPRHIDAHLERLDPSRSCFEHLFMGLRTTAGVDRAAFERRFGVDLDQVVGPQLATLQEDGLVELGDRAVRPTQRGMMFGDDVALRLLPK